MIHQANKPIKSRQIPTRTVELPEPRVLALTFTVVRETVVVSDSVVMAPVLGVASVGFGAAVVPPVTATVDGTVGVSVVVGFGWVVGGFVGLGFVLFVVGEVSGHQNSAA